MPGDEDGRVQASHESSTVRRAFPPDARPLSSPETPIAPVQFQHSVPTTLLDDSVNSQKGPNGIARRSSGRTPDVRAAASSPVGAFGNVERRAASNQRETNGNKQTDQELGHESRQNFRREPVVRSNTLNLYTSGGMSIDEHLLPTDNAATLPSPPPSDVNTSPLLSPVEGLGELPILNGIDGRHAMGSSVLRDRSSSSVLEFGPPMEPRPAPEPSGSKDRTMSETRPSESLSRTQSTPGFRRKASSTKPATGSGVPSEKRPLKDLPAPIKMDRTTSSSKPRHEGPLPSPIPDALPMPPLSMPTFLQLELSSGRPPPLYIYRPSTTEHPFEPTSAKAERLMNFLILPPQLERVLLFGVLACVDAWLYNFTILPLRFFGAVSKLVRSMIKNLWSEFKFLVDFIPTGTRRVWQRQIQGPSEPPTPATDSETPSQSFTRSPPAQFPFPEAGSKSPPFLQRIGRSKRHRRSRSVASSLVSAEKADILKGCLIVGSTLILMQFDASMMYHSIRGQAAIKLYVIYNVLEVFDRLLSAIGQDILECLFAPETLTRHANGRSKILRPLSLFPIALIYVLIHATALYYQVITLNVAVNSYSNALLTLLMSNQFVEIKGTVFKRIEKENLFQMTCADVVERFQLWLMLVIIASRNIIETSAASMSSSTTTTAPLPTSPTLLPFSFTIFPSLSFSQILNPFILVLGTETIVDWIKHAYITKFNNVKPNLYGRYLDVLAKDYYGNAFADPNLTKRIGLPVIPLTCLAVRAAVQTYHMFREHLVPAPLASSVTNNLSSPSISPTTAAALRHIDSLFLAVVGQHPPIDTDGTSANTTAHPFLPSTLAALYLPTWLRSLATSSLNLLPTTATLLSWASTALVLALIYLVLLAAKIVLGMLLLSYARNRYKGMKAREHESTYQEGRRNGGWGITELDEDKRRWIYADDPGKAAKLRERDREGREKAKDGGGKGEAYEKVERYRLGGSKRIW